MIFESLVSFKFISKNKLDLKIIKNVINNLDKISNIKILIFKAIIEIDEFTYKKFKEKLLLSNIKNIEFDLNMNDDAKDFENEYSQKYLNNI